MKNIKEMFVPFAARMLAEGLPQIFIDNFATYYEQLVLGSTGLIPENEIKPLSTVPDMEKFPERLKVPGEKALQQTAVIKLNGGLGTSMGLQNAKSLLLVKDGLSFLDIIAKQTIQSKVPLVLMNSFVTEEDTLAALETYLPLRGDLAQSFLQHKELKIEKSKFQPVKWPQDPSLEWCPPGHGDIYLAMVTSDSLSGLLDSGYRYAFVSNADNLGAVLDTQLLGYFAENNIPFMMEVTDRTEMDSKGGHLALSKEDGRLILRESAQCPDEDMGSFQDISRHKFFNTNNLWINLLSLQKKMDERKNKLGLPIIRNQKTVDPRDENSTQVFQLETAMGSAISVFEGANAVRVPRSRFAPVKTTNDLLAVRSDLFQLSDKFHVIPNPKRELGSVHIELDERFYKFVIDLDNRFPEGEPSLLECSALRIRGDFCFEKDVVCKGDVSIINDMERQIVITEGTVLEG
jgi:UTP--glucose-1-phosphate uridylyltransferase